MTSFTNTELFLMISNLAKETPLTELYMLATNHDSEGSFRDPELKLLAQFFEPVNEGVVTYDAPPSYILRVKPEYAGPFIQAVKARISEVERQNAALHNVVRIAITNWGNFDLTLPTLVVGLRTGLIPVNIIPPSLRDMFSRFDSSDNYKVKPEYFDVINTVVHELYDQNINSKVTDS